MNIREISVARLKEYENNPRNNDLAVEKVKYSIERFGFMFPVVVDLNYTIVCGHTRVRACKEMGIQTVPCIIAEELTDEQINLFRLVDNKTSEYSDWDFEKLKSELSLVDLTLDKNQLLLERFELSVDVFDLEPELAEIKIPTFNFMKGGDKPKEMKPPVNTIKSLENDAIETDDDAVEVPSVQTKQPVPVSAGVGDSVGSPESKRDPAQAETTAAAETVKEPKAPPSVLIQFRFGDVAFYISQVELDRLNKKYTECIDSGAILQGSFAEYLLKGVEHDD